VMKQCHWTIYLFVHDDLMDVLVRETNRYAKQYIDNTSLKPESRVKQWKPTTRREIKLFLGIALLMGIIKKPNIEFYWSETEIFLTPAFSKLMTRNRFCLLLKFLHFANNDDKSTDRDDDKLYKILKVYDSITPRRSSRYMCQESKW